MIKDLILGEIEERLSNIDDDWIQKWVNDEVSILEDFMKPNETIIRSFKSTALEAIDTITTQDLQDCCFRAKPRLQDMWITDKATHKMNTELTNIKNYISKL